MIPRTLNEWTLDSLKRLLDNRCFEAESFDYKEMPHPKNAGEKSRIRDACAAFANSGGGFLVFGIHDDAQVPADQRMKGIASSVDFPEQFGNFPSQVNPSVRWEILNPPINLPNGNVVHVVWIPKSWNAPHAVGKAEEGLRFPKRTNKGTEFMSYEETRMHFLGYYEKRLQLRLLDAELLAMQETAVIAHVKDNVETSYSLNTFDMATINTIIADTFILTADYPELLASLKQLRQQAVAVNNKLRIFFSSVSLPFANKGAIVREHNGFMAGASHRIEQLAKQSRELLKPLLTS